MTRNQKIALGCGGGGCLGIIVLLIFFAVLSTFGYLNMPWSSTNSNYNFNVNNNRNSNFNSNLNSNLNRNSNSNSSSSSSSSSMSSDEKHRLYQAAGMTKDSALMLRVINKIGLGDGTGSSHQQFVKEHFAWAMNNLDFIQSVNTPETARAYVEEHIED